MYWREAVAPELWQGGDWLVDPADIPYSQQVQSILCIQKEQLMPSSCCWMCTIPLCNVTM